jgi:hypothetical protein
VGFLSCDRRKSPSESLKYSIKEFNEEHSGVAIIKYYPNEYTEVVTDTLISNKVKIHIRNYSLLDKSILMTVDKKKEKHHRVFESNVVVSTPTKEILKTHISAEVFKSKYSEDFWNHATLQHVWVNEELSSPEDIKLDMTFINPSEDSYKLFRMSIYRNGKQKVELIEERT